MQTKVKTCIIHRYTLYNNDICFKCEKKCVDTLNETLFNCSLCYDTLEKISSSCFTCFACTKCKRYNRLEGYCKFCGIFFNSDILKTLFKKNPSKIFCYLFNSEFSFNNLNNRKNIERYLITLILDYL